MTTQDSLNHRATRASTWRIHLGLFAVLILSLSVSVHAQPDVTQPGDPIVATSNNTPGSEGAANAIDNQPTKYLNFDKLNTGFTVSPVAGLTVVSGLTLTSANDAPERDPASYTLSGSYDGSNFTQIASGSVPAFPSRFFKHTILFENKIPYLKYRLIFPTVANDGAANSMQIAEVELLGVVAPGDVTIPTDPIVPTSNNSPGLEGAANAIDNQPTKYLNFDKLNTGFTVAPSVGGTIVIGLTLTSANDAPERDPASYVLTGANDGVNFVPISSGNVPPFPSRFYKNYIFFPDNTNSFTSYRLIFPTVVNAGAANAMQIAEVEFLGVQPGVVNTNPATDLIVRQPVDTLVLLGSTATFRVGLSGPWNVQWYRNGVAIPGATTATYTTLPATAADDGALFKAVVQSPHGVQTSDEVMLSIFTPSTTESVGLSWRGAGANGAPTGMLPDDITGFHPQAYWNNLAGGSGSLASPLNSSNAAHPTITVTWATSGEWGVGTGNSDPLERMLNGMATSFSTTEGSAQTVTLSGAPPGNHSVFLYTVQVPQEFFNMDFAVVTHDSGGNDVIQRRYIRPLNSDEYNLSPGFSLVTSDSAASRGVGNMMRFDNVQSGPDGIIQVRFFSPGRVDLPGGDPIRGPGLNGMQLVLNAPNLGAPPVITRQPASANGITGGCITLCVEATGPGLTYQWLKNGQQIAGATDPCLTLSNLRTNDAGNYTVIVSNPAGPVRSRTAVVGVVSSAQLTLGLIAYFKFDDSGGADGVTATNSAPGGQNGQVQGSLPDFLPGQVGNGLVFNGVDNYVFVPNYTKVNQAMTVSGWILPPGGQGGPVVNNWVEGQTTGASGQFLVDLRLDNNGATTVHGLIEVGPNRVQATAPIDDDPFIWHHFVMSANGVTLSLYWDGQLVSAVDYLGSINTTPSIPWLAIGAILNGTQTPDPAITPNVLRGALDDLAMWNRSLSEIEIRAIYNGGLSGRDVSQVAPVLTSGTCSPTLNCSANIVAECTGGLTPVTYAVTAVDGESNPVPVTCTPPSGTGFRLGTSNVVCTATDSLGNSNTCSFTVMVVDSTPPVITCPPNQTNEWVTGSVPVFAIPTASDACDSNLTITFVDTELPATCPDVRLFRRTWTATDDSTNRASCSQTITFLDSTPPVITCPPNQTNEWVTGSVPVFAIPTASDACDTNLTITFVDTELPATCPAVRIFRRTWTATDDCTNRASCTQTITFVDTTPPVITCPANLTVSCLSNVPPCPGSLAAFLALGGTARDNLDTDLTYTCTDGALMGGTCSGTITRTHTVTDDCTNSASCVQLITVRDDVAPTIANVSVDKASLWPPNHKMQEVTVDYTATDDCDSNVTCALSVTSNEPINGTGDRDTAPDWEIVDTHHVKLRAERAAAGNGRIYTIAIVCSDCSGNMTTNAVYVVVAHDIKSPVSGAAFKVNSAVTFTGTFWDIPGNKHTAYWTFDNLSTSGNVTEPSGLKNGTVKGSYKFNAPGVYKVTLFIKDQKGVTSWVNTAGDVESIVVIYDPNGGYTIGGGWIDSPPRAYALDPSLTGKLSFGFSSQYFKGAANPKGETLVKFLAGDLEFSALNFEYLSISGAKAQFRGFGKINGVSGYNFILTVIDGALASDGVDKFRIKIWEKNSGVILYDNEPGHSDADNPLTSVGAASSVIIKK